MHPLRLTWYGDDLTGSTDVLEALHLRGVAGVLFTRRPDADRLARFADVHAVGLAGTSRSETPAWMDAHLPDAFRFLAGLGAPICHYKVCSTFDSAPAIGSIGRALELGRAVFGDQPVPIVVGAPELGRYTAFGHLFARYAGQVYRIDRHPVMRQHPTTPMDEADLVRHLGRQTSLRIGHVDQVTLTGAGADEAVDAQAGDAVLLDVADAASQRAAGRQILRLSDQGSRFVIGSSGVEYALAQVWEHDVLPPPDTPPGSADRIAVVSGSVSPTTERQIHAAEQDGFARLALDPTAFFRDGGEADIRRTQTAALTALAQGRSVIIHTALGPATDRGADLVARGGTRHDIGRGLGALMASLVREAGLRRVVIAGGDTSSHALGEMGVFALTICLPLPATPGSPLCTAHSADAAIDGLQLALKGGQIGGDDYFLRIRAGAVSS